MRPRHAHAAFPVNPSTSGFQAIPMFSLPPPTSAAHGLAIPAPLLPYPGVPFPPMGLGSPVHELHQHQLNLLQSVNRAQQSAVGDAHKMKTPINRNYLELAMLVCNTFRGKLFPCPHCRYVTDRRNNLKRHISTMHQTCDKQLECCGVSFSTKASLREHIMIFHHNGYSCPYCGRRFCRKALLKRHLSVHSGQKDYTCPSCDYATSHKSNLERHKRIHERLKLGEDGTLFDCGDFTSHHLPQSPDTTDRSCMDGEPRGRAYVEMDTDDESSDIDVMADNDDEDDVTDIDEYKRSHFPIFKTSTIESTPLHFNKDVSTQLCKEKDKDRVETKRHLSDVAASETRQCEPCSSSVPDQTDPGLKAPQELAIDYSKSKYSHHSGEV